MSAVIFFACLDLEQKSSFMDGHELVWKEIYAVTERSFVCWDSNAFALILAFVKNLGFYQFVVLIKKNGGIIIGDDEPDLLSGLYEFVKYGVRNAKTV
jgi:hypothetical protein